VPAAPIRPSFDPRANAGVGGLAHSPGLPYQIQPSLIEGRTVVIEYRWAKGRTERYAEIAAEFVRRKVDVIVAYGTPSALAAKRSTAVIPIVFAAAGDPVASLARPGGNVTGLSVQQTDLAGKRLEILREPGDVANIFANQSVLVGSDIGRAIGADIGYCLSLGSP
jgi:hypothetical protein